MPAHKKTAHHTSAHHGHLTAHPESDPAVPAAPETPTEAVHTEPQTTPVLSGETSPLLEHALTQASTQQNDDLPSQIPWHQAATPGDSQTEPQIYTPQPETTEATHPGTEPVSSPYTPVMPPPSSLPTPSQLPDISDSGESPSGRIYLLCIICSLTCLLIGLAAGYLLSEKFKRPSPQLDNSTTNVQVSPTSVPTSTPTPMAKADLTKYSLKVLNGSGTSGEAAKAETLLKSAGFKVSSIGNADKSNYTKTVIQAGDSVDSAFLENLKTELSKKYKLDEIGKKPAKESADVVVIIGQE